MVAKRNFTLTVPLELHQAFKIHAVKAKRTMQAIIIELMRQYLAKAKGRPA